MLIKKLKQSLSQKKEQNLYRKLKEKNKEVINFSSNDSLGLSLNQILIKKSQEYTEKYGCGSQASRLVTGNLPIHTKIEKKIAEFKGFESSLLLNSGYQANLSLLASLINRNTFVFIDKNCHHSLIMGAKLGGGSILRYRHNDYKHLRQLLNKHQSQPLKIIITESLFSMDGDQADLKELLNLKKEFQAMLYIDEAHATGICGEQGKGLAIGSKNKNHNKNNNKNNFDVVVGTFGKAFGSFGAYVACSKFLKEYFINHCGGIIYSTALPPSILGAIDAGLDLIAQMEPARAHVKDMTDLLRKEVNLLGYDTGTSTTHIIPLIMNSPKKALSLQAFLELYGFLAMAIRSPTVPKSTDRVRLSISANHTKEQMNQLLKTLKKFKKKQILLQHGWGYDASFWGNLTQEPLKNHNFLSLDQGYFKKSPNTNTQEHTQMIEWDTVITHSLGLHLLPKQVFSNTKKLIILGGFVHFHPFKDFETFETAQSPQSLKLSKKAIDQMLLFLEKKDPSVLMNFYKKASRPYKSTPKLKEFINWKQLIKDLTLLNNSFFDLSLIKGIPEVYSIHGKKDAIIKNKIQINSNFPNIKEIIIEEEGHTFSLDNLNATTTPSFFPNLLKTLI